MSVWSHWNVTPEEAAASYPCDDHAPRPGVRLLRGVFVGAPPSVVFRWVCQVRVAPYSYDLLDNFGRRSPRTLTPGADDLAVGQDFQPFRIVAFERDEHITAVTKPAAALVFGPIAVSYVVRPDGDTTRLLGVICARRAGLLDRARLAVLAPGDLVMMRKQLLTLRDLAENAPQEAVPA